MRTRFCHANGHFKSRVAGVVDSLVPRAEPTWWRQCMRGERMGMFPNNVIGSSSESNATITIVDTDARAGISAIGA